MATDSSAPTRRRGICRNNDVCISRIYTGPTWQGLLNIYREKETSLLSVMARRQAISGHNCVSCPDQYISLQCRLLSTYKKQVLMNYTFAITRRRDIGLVITVQLILLSSVNKRQFTHQCWFSRFPGARHVETQQSPFPELPPADGITLCNGRFVFAVALGAHLCK